MNNVAIIGAGPAGVASSIYLKRSGIDVTLFERKKIGGLLLNANLVENYPGFPKGIKGIDLCNLMKEQLDRWNIKPVISDVNKIVYENEYYLLKIKNRYHRFKAVILAAGTKPIKLNLIGEKKLEGRLIFYEIVDMIPKIKPQDSIIVIGGGDAAFDYSLSLIQQKAKVRIFHRSKNFKCLTLLYNRLLKSQNIKLYPSYKPIEIKENNGEVEIIFKSDNGKKIIAKSNYALIACGREPNKDLVSKIFKNNFISGLYIVGDANLYKFRQAGIAIGDGLLAAMKVEKFIREINCNDKIN